MSGLSKLAIKESEVMTAIDAATKMSQLLQESSSKSKTLLSKVESSNWSGEARDSFVSYLNIVQQFHKDMYSTSKKQTAALKAISKGITSYESNSEVSKVKSL